jgi:hypothetical protein
MGKKKLADIIRACTKAGTLIGVVALLSVLSLFSSCQPTVPALVTLNCTDQTASSLKGQGEVTATGGQLLSRRGFVWLEGDGGDPVLDLTAVPVLNPSFEEGAPPTGWNYYQPGVSGNYSSSAEHVESGNYSLEAVSYNYTNAIITQTISDWEQYKGKTITLGAWVWANGKADIMLRWGGFWDVTDSEGHPGDSQWRWIMVSRAIRDTDTTLTIMLRAGSGASLSTTAYFDGVVLAEGAAVFEEGTFDTGNYSLTIGGLKPNTSYRVRAFGENEAGITYGNTVTCKTAAD